MSKKVVEMIDLMPVSYIEIRDGSPLIAGTGVKVAIIANMHVHHQTPIEWIVENYDLTPAQIHAALSYYYDHAEELDRSVQSGDDLVQQIGIPSSEILDRMRQRKNQRKSE